MSEYRSISYADCAGCPATHIPLLTEGMPSRRELCVTHFRLATFEAKRPIYNVGDPGAALFMVRRGLLKLVRYAHDGAQRVVRLLCPGDSFGFEALLGRPYQHLAVAATACEVCRMPADTILRYGRGNPDVLNAILTQYDKSMDMADMFLAELSTGSAPVRVARLLLFLESVGDETGAPLLSREDMGDVLGISTETASRVIAEFRRHGWVEPAGEHRCRCDIEGLVGIATQ
jgi:CRP-like cAMP-binding protein